LIFVQVKSILDIRHISKNDIFVEMVKHVLYLSYDGMTDPLGQSQVLPYIIGLTKAGYSFHLVSFEKPDRYSENRHTIEDICKENNIDWHPLMYTKRPPLFSTIWDVLKMRRISNQINNTHGLSLIHCRSYISALIGLSFKRKKGIPFLFDMRGFWADERVDGGLWNLDNPLYKLVYNFFKKKEQSFLLYSNHSVSLTHAGKVDIIQREGYAHLASKISVIPCCADLKLFKPYQRDNHEQFTIGYLGSLGTWYMLDEMLLFFKQLLYSKPTAIFHFLTKDDPNLIFNKARELSIEKERFIVEESTRADLPFRTRNWDYSIFFILPSYSKKSSSPTKQGELMGLGIPIICNKGVGDVDAVVEKFDSGIAIDIDKDFDIEACLNKVYNEENIVNGARDYFSLEQGVKDYLGIYEKII
tara:strand:- start:14074 stop:15318 length:1245 start_codon:yes stop_codon:yes gene_type:complete